MGGTRLKYPIFLRPRLYKFRLSTGRGCYTPTTGNPFNMSFTDKIKAAIKGDVKEGAKLETGIKLKESNPEQADVSLDNLTGKSVIVGVPGAFTP